MGGVLQFLFGITCKRYEENDEFKPYINEYFVYPDAKDRPNECFCGRGWLLLVKYFDIWQIFDLD